MALHQKYNNESILSRAIIAGLLNILNNEIIYQQIWANDVVEDISIPWYYNMSGDERFMQDFYTHYADCIPPKPVDGNFDQIPRGILTYNGSVIDSARTTSRYIQGNYLKEVNGQVQTYRSFLYSIPLTVNFECELWVDTQVTGLKIEQIIRETFYKTKTFYVYYKGMRIGCTVGFPEDLTMEKNIQYSFETNNSTVPKIKFNLQVESYQPVFDTTTEVDANSYLRSIGMRLMSGQDVKSDGIIVLTSPADSSADNPLIVPKGYPLWLEWDYTDENAIIDKVDIYWIDASTGEQTEIERFVVNNEYYVWNIPDNFTNYKHPAMMWDENASISIYRKPIVRITPDTSTGTIDASSFTIVDTGYFLAASADTSIKVVLEMKNVQGRVVYSGDSSLFFNIVGYKIDETNPVTLPYGPIIFPGTVDYKLINIKVANSVNNDIYDIIENIKIV